MTDLSDWPPEANRVDRVGSYLTPNVEAVIAHRPDLVIAVPSPGNREAVESLESLGLHVVMVKEGPTVSDVFASIVAIASAAGRPDAGRALVTRLQERIDIIGKRVQALPRRRVLMIVGENPLVAVGDGNLLDELLRRAGAENVARGLGVWPRLSVEFLVKSDPEIIIDSSMGDESKSDLSFYAGLGLAALESKQVHAVRLDELLRPGPRLADGLEKLARRVHPEAFGSEPARGTAAR